MERYLIKRAPVSMGDISVGQTEYRFRGDASRVAFTESTFKLSTDTNSPSVARSMVDVAQTRNWQALRISGNEEFKRIVWLEASVRGFKTLGYEPNTVDLEALKKTRDARQVNRVEPAHGPAAPDANATSAKASSRGGGGRKAVLAAIDAVLVSKKVPEKQREAIITAASDRLAQRSRADKPVQVKLYDRAAPAQRPNPAPNLEQQLGRERSAQVR